MNSVKLVYDHKNLPLLFLQEIEEMAVEAAALDLNLPGIIRLLQLSQIMASNGLPEASGFLDRAVLIAEAAK